MLLGFLRETATAVGNVWGNHLSPVPRSAGHCDRSCVPGAVTCVLPQHWLTRCGSLPWHIWAGCEVRNSTPDPSTGQDKMGHLRLRKSFGSCEDIIGDRWSPGSPASVKGKGGSWGSVLICCLLLFWPDMTRVPFLSGEQQVVFQIFCHKARVLFISLPSRSRS